jgi:hypothetical protein
MKTLDKLEEIGAKEIKVIFSDETLIGRKTKHALLHTRVKPSPTQGRKHTIKSSQG